MLTKKLEDYAASIARANSVILHHMEGHDVVVGTRLAFTEMEQITGRLCADQRADGD